MEYQTTTGLKTLKINDMKTFMYTLGFKKSSYGQNVTNKVYQIKNNIPTLVGERHYNTGSYRGHDHEAMQVIIDAKLLPLNCMDSPKHGYIVGEKRSFYEGDKENKLYRLFELK